MSVKSYILLGLVGWAGVIATPTFAGVVDCTTLGSNLVTNCGFETGDTTGWALSGDTSFTGVSDTLVHSGAFSLDLGSISSLTFLTQDIPTVIDGTYDLFFWLANDGGSGTSFAVSWNGVKLYSESDAPSYGYTSFDFPNLAPSSGATTQLQFAATQVPAYYHLDDVRVSATGMTDTPEPGTMTLLIVSLGIGGPFLRRRLNRYSTGMAKSAL